MTPTNIPPCPVCGVVPIVVPPNLHNSCFDMLEVCDCFGYDCEISTHNWTDRCNQELGRACRELGIETVEQLIELVGIACDACDERTVRATNRAENLVPLLRRRAGEGWR